MDEYYKEKILKLHDRLFLHTGNAKEKIIENDELIRLLIKLSGSQPNNINEKWLRFGELLYHKGKLISKDGVHVLSAIENTLGKKKNKSFESFLLFILEENERFRS